MRLKYAGAGLEGNIDTQKTAAAALRCSRFMYRENA